MADGAAAGRAQGKGGGVTGRQEPDGAGYRASKAGIRRWLQWCVEQRCFCPLDGDAAMDLRHNVAPYVSSPGSDGHGPGPHPSFLRVVPDPRHGRPLLVREAAQLQALRGKELRMYCHMGAEPSVYELALQELTGIKMSLSGLLGGAPIYDTDKPAGAAARADGPR